MKIYTKTGDKGTTSLFDGTRVMKNHPRLEAYGTLDELNSTLGVAVSLCNSEEINKIIIRVQEELFSLGAILATPVESGDKKNAITKVNVEFINRFEEEIDLFNDKVPPMKVFILPGGSKGASYLHLARTVTRRCERLAIDLREQVEFDDNLIIYLNRLSDLLFVLARYENFVNNVEDIKWEPQK